jgi:hypothetical protein
MGQQLLLDFNTVLSPDLMTECNTTNLLTGINESNSPATLGVPNGGLGSNQFTPGQTLVFNGIEMISSGYGPIAVVGPLINDDRYYTKTEVDAFFDGLGSAGGYPVSYLNITGAPTPGVQLQFITPVQIFSGTVAQASPVQYVLSPIVGHTIVGALITVTCSLSGPDGTYVAQLLVSATAVSAQTAAGWFWAGGSGDAVGGATVAVAPVDGPSQSFFYQLIGKNSSGGTVSSGTTVVAGGTPVVVTLIGYFFY